MRASRPTGNFNSITHFQIYAYGGEVRFSPPAAPYLQFLISNFSFLIPN